MIDDVLETKTEFSVVLPFDLGSALMGMAREIRQTPSEIVSRACREFLARERQRSSKRPPKATSDAMTVRDWVAQVSPTKKITGCDVGSPPAPAGSNACAQDVDARPAVGDDKAAISSSPRREPAVSPGKITDGPQFPKFTAAMREIARSRDSVAAPSKDRSWDARDGGPEAAGDGSGRSSSRLIVSFSWLYILPAAVILLIAMPIPWHLLPYVYQESKDGASADHTDHRGGTKSTHRALIAANAALPSEKQTAPYEPDVPVGGLDGGGANAVSWPESSPGVLRSPYRTNVVSTPTSLISFEAPYESDAIMLDAPHVDEAAIDDYEMTLSNGILPTGALVEKLDDAREEIYFLQMGSYYNNEIAKEAWIQMSNSLKPLLDYVDPYFETSEIDGLVYHRVQIGPFAAWEYAAEFCVEIKKNGFDCFVARRKTTVPPEMPGEQREQVLDPDRTVESESERASHRRGEPARDVADDPSARSAGTAAATIEPASDGGIGPSAWAATTR